MQITSANKKTANGATPLFISTQNSDADVCTMSLLKNANAKKTKNRKWCNTIIHGITYWSNRCTYCVTSKQRKCHQKKEIVQCHYS